MKELDHQTHVSTVIAPAREPDDRFDGYFVWQESDALIVKDTVNGITVRTPLSHGESIEEAKMLAMKDIKNLLASREQLRQII